MQLTSSAYTQGAAIPRRFTCEGQDISPDFSWLEVPKETKAFVLILHDPDAPRPNGFVHWVVYNIAGTLAHIEENVPKRDHIDGLGLQGRNDAGKIGYMGPSPPSGTHRYFARLYALRNQLKLQAGATYNEVISAMEGNVIEQTELMGTYAKAAQKTA